MRVRTTGLPDGRVAALYTDMVDTGMGTCTEEVLMQFPITPIRTQGISIAAAKPPATAAEPAKAQVTVPATIEVLAMTTMTATVHRQKSP